MENETRVISEKQQNLFDELTQSKMAKKAAIGSRWYYEMLEDAVEANIVTDENNVPYTDVNDITEDNLPNLYFHFDDGAAYQLSFDASDGNQRVWLDGEHPIWNFEEHIEEKKNATAEGKKRAEDELIGREYDNLMKLDLDDPENMPAFRQSLQTMIDHKAAYVPDGSGRWKPAKSIKDVNLSDLSDLALRTSSDGDAKAMPEKDISAQFVKTEFEEEIPAKPQTWGPFQFLRSWANSISKAFGGSGLKEYRDYDKKMEDFQAKKYYTLASNGYRCEKPAHLAQVERQRAVDALVQMTFTDLVEDHEKNQDINFIGKGNPLNNPAAEDAIRKNLMDSENLDKFVNDPKTQSFLRTVGMGKEPTGEQDKNLVQAGKDVRNFFYAAVNKYKDQRYKEMVEAEKATQGIREANDTINKNNRKKADEISENVGALLNENAGGKNKAFLKTLSDAMAANTVDAWGVKHLMQDAVKENQREFLQELCNDFDPQAKENTAKALQSLVNPAKNGVEAGEKYGKTMSAEFLGHVTEISESVQQRFEKMNPTAAAVKPEEPANQRDFDGPSANNA